MDATSEESFRQDARRYRELLRHIGLASDGFVLSYPKGWKFDIHSKDNLDSALDFMLRRAPTHHPECLRHCMRYMRHNEASCHGYCAWHEALYAAPQVPAMVTSGASGQNVEAGQSDPHSAKSDAPCDERLAGGSNPAALLP